MPEITCLLDLVGLTVRNLTEEQKALIFSQAQQSKVAGHWFVIMEEFKLLKKMLALTGHWAGKFVALLGMLFILGGF